MLDSHSKYNKSVRQIFGPWEGSYLQGPALITLLLAPLGSLLQPDLYVNQAFNARLSLSFFSRATYEPSFQCAALPELFLQSYIWTKLSMCGSPWAFSPELHMNQAFNAWLSLSFFFRATYEPSFQRAPRSACFFLVAYLAHSSTLMMKTVRSSETSINFYQTTWRHISEDTTRYKTLCPYFSWITLASATSFAYVGSEVLTAVVM
jgi:hypothetical protein